MKTLNLTRFCYAEEGTFGWFLLDGYRLYTVEQAWRGNETGVSCIPEGTYRCVPTFYNRGNYDAIEITGVPDRSRILFHKANWPHQLRGCIAPVWGWDCVANPRTGDTEIGGPSSGRAFELLMKHYGDAPFWLKIKGREIDFSPWQENSQPFLG